MIYLIGKTCVDNLKVQTMKCCSDNIFYTVMPSEIRRIPIFRIKMIKLVLIWPRVYHN